MIGPTTYTRPYLYPKQHEAFFTPKRFSYTEASTKAGKTVGAIAWIIEQALMGKPHQNFWWVAPVSAQADIAFTRIKNNLSRGSFTPYGSPTPKITLLNQTHIWFKSADSPDSLYGEDVFAAVVDEASRAKEEAWHALRSTLTATQGPVRCIGNVKGRKNWFYRMARMAESGDYADMHYTKITVLDAIAAGVIPQSEIDSARRDLPDHVFRELYMAEAGDDSGNPFGLDHIQACTLRDANGRLSSQIQSNMPPVAFGIDLAKKKDYLVVIGLDADGRVCVFQRWQHVPWPEAIQRIHQIVGEDVPALVDSTGLGDPVLEVLQKDHGNFSGYLFSRISKQKLMEGLAVSIQSHEIMFPDGPIRNELEVFEFLQTRTGTVYSAPEGFHDDCVCALALAREQWTTAAPGASLMQFYSEQATKQRAQLLAQSLDEGADRPYAWAGPKAAHTQESLGEILENELTELYEKTMAEYQAASLSCFRCHEPIRESGRVSDGIHFWHMGCV